MKKYVLLGLLVTIFLNVVSVPVYAHFPKTDGDMTVTLHVDPNDDPIPGKSANLYFLFDEGGRSFGVSDCSCTVSIYEQGKRISKKALVVNDDKPPSIWGLRLPYVFPQSDVYQIVLTGKPRTVESFQPFTLSWYFRVDPDSGNAGLVVKRSSDMPMLLAFAFGGCVALILFGFFIKKEISGSENLDNTKHSRYNKKR